MTKRESGWYRVVKQRNSAFSLMQYDSRFELWMRDGMWKALPASWIADNKMVMTPDGQIVYNQPAHDPLYNTKQEG